MTRGCREFVLRLTWVLRALGEYIRAASSESVTVGVVHKECRTNLCHFHAVLCVYLYMVTCHNLTKTPLPQSPPV